MTLMRSKKKPIEQTESIQLNSNSLKNTCSSGESPTIINE